MLNLQFLNQTGTFYQRPLTNSNDNGLLTAFTQALIDETKWIELASLYTISQNLQPCYGIMPDWNPAEIVGTARASLRRLQISDYERHLGTAKPSSVTEMRDH